MDEGKFGSRIFKSTAQHVKNFDKLVFFNSNQAPNSMLAMRDAMRLSIIHVGLSPAPQTCYSVQDFFNSSTFDRKLSFLL